MSDCPYKFAIHPGFIFRRYDNPTRGGFIGYSHLIKLYDLNPKDCVRWDNIIINGRDAVKHYPDYVHLHPRADGDYAAELIRGIMRFEMREGPESDEKAFGDAFAEACRE